jgi:ATPase subunit of ABC transporter with duplicated ATPase domains
MATLVQISKASKSYAGQVLLENADAVISDKTKVGFVGRNGAGKSTLLRILLGEEELDSGEVIRYPNLRLGYLRQHDPFLPNETTLEFLMRDSGQPDWRCGEVAGQFEIKGAYLDGPITKLSGGWQTRAKLAAVLLHDPNLLLLDEPTNFLDLRTQILLEHFLRDYRAACVIVSHDRAFLAATCTHTLDLSRGKLTTFPGKIDAFLVFQKEKREHDERSNAAITAKRRHLEDFPRRILEPVERLASLTDLSGQANTVGSLAHQKVGAAMSKKKGRKFGLSWSWKRAIGLSAAKSKLSKEIGIPLTRSGRQRKLGRMMGCCITLVVLLGVVATAIGWLVS